MLHSSLHKKEREKHHFKTLKHCEKTTYLLLTENEKQY